jgi:hypothetical protein
MKRVLAIARLTFWEGIRMRIVLVFLIILVFLVLRLPFTLHGDGTLTGRLQNFLAYSLGALSVLLSLTTIFFSCATLSGELRDRSLHLVVTKPVSRFEILAGKWLGVNLLNVLILALCGGAIYGLAYFIQSRQEQFPLDRYKVRDTVWTARVAAQPVVPQAEIRKAAEEYVNSRKRTGEIPPGREEIARQERETELLTQWRTIEAGDARVFRFENITPPDREDTLFQVRYKARATPLPLDEMATIGFAFCDPNTHTPLEEPTFLTERSNDTHQFLIRARTAIKDGAVELLVINPYNPGRRAMAFEGDKSLQLLYRTAGFELNFARALVIILIRLALLSALGVFFSVFVSFPVACLCVASFFLLCLGLPFWLDSMGANVENYLPKDDPYGVWGPMVRGLLVPVMKAVFPDFSYYDGTRSVVDGEYVPMQLLLQGVLHTLLYGGALLLLPGWLIFRVREVAEVQV